MKEEKKYELVKFKDGELEVEVSVSPKEETIWMTANQMALLFNKDEKTIRKHINNIFKDGELIFNNNTQKMRVDGVKQMINIYNLNVIISVGYRVKSNIGVKFRIWANKVLKDYLLKGYDINGKRVVVTNENFNNLLLVVNDIKSNQINLNERVEKIEEKVFDKEYGLDKIFYDGEFYDAYTLIQSIFESAKNEIIIIDNYVDRSILDRLVVKRNNVSVNIYTDFNKSMISNNDINSFNSQYGLLKVIDTKKVHDRYIIIDRIKLYHLGHSIKDLGKKIFSIIESDSMFINELLKNI